MNAYFEQWQDQDVLGLWFLNDLVAVFEALINSFLFNFRSLKKISSVTFRYFCRFYVSRSLSTHRFFYEQGFNNPHLMRVLKDYQ